MGHFDTANKDLEKTMCVQNTRRCIRLEQFLLSSSTLTKALDPY